MAESTITGWLRRQRIELGFALRMTVAGLLSFAAAHLFAAPQTYWAVLTAVIVTQTTIGASLKATVDRLVSTLGGAAWGGAVTAAIPHGDPVAAGFALAAALTPLALLVGFRPEYRTAPVTAAIVLLGHGTGGVIGTAFDRLLEIALGCVAAFAVALTVSPARAHKNLYAATADALDRMAEQISLLMRGVAAPPGPAAVTALHDSIRTAIERAAAATDEAVRERRSHLSYTPDPEPLVRTLRRMSHDLVTAARAVAMPFPERISTQLAGPAAALGAAVAARMAAIGAALAAGAAPPANDPAAAAFAAYAVAMSDLRRDGLTRGLADADVERVFSLLFGLDELHRNLDELAERLAERLPPSTVG